MRAGVDVAVAQMERQWNRQSRCSRLADHMRTFIKYAGFTLLVSDVTSMLPKGHILKTLTGCFTPDCGRDLCLPSIVTI